MTITARTRSGVVAGVERDATVAFLGIPFAAAPVGERRWALPTREAAWEGTRDATDFGPRSVQGEMMLEQMMGAQSRPWSEDCLYLNVFTPAADDGKRPVMVWIHGGAFVFGEGATPWYDGSRLAAAGDVVVVTINYRLGALGFLHLEDLFGERFAGSGNLGIADQVAALEWVRDSIAGFGGDPDNVTIFGESAGGASVGTLLGTPSARGLFTGAIPQSGAASWCSTREQATETARKVLEHAGIPIGDVDALLAAPVETLLAAQQAVGGEIDPEVVSDSHGLPFQPVHDGTVLPQRPLDAIAAGNADGVRVLIGTNADEMTLFTLMDPGLATLQRDGLVTRLSAVVGTEQAADIVTEYVNQRPDASVADLWTALATDAVFRIPAVRLAEAQIGHGPVWMYLFTWATPAFGGLLRSTHALEIPFVFDNLDQPGIEVFTGTGPERAAIAARMSQAWLAFARAGDPGWPEYSVERRATMRIDAEWELVDDPAGHERKLWDGHAH